LVVFIHGGGFEKGDKKMWRDSPQLASFWNNGFACAALNYPFRETCGIQDILRDIARGVQFMRSKAQEWNLDKTRFAGWGGSAGAGSSLWLVTRDDLADPDNTDPVLRESSRLQAAVLSATQATYNMPRWDSFMGPPKPEWLRSPTELIDFYHIKSEAELATPEGKAVLSECDMLRWIGSGDGPVFIIVNQPDGEPRNRGHYLHHPNHAEEIRKAYKANGIPCTVARKNGDPEAPVRFLSEKLKASPVDFPLSRKD
jgi:acetyl esterase/lipase